MQRVWRNLNYGLEVFWSYLRQWYQAEICLKNMFSSTCQLWTLLVYTAKDPWPPFRNIAIVRHSRPTLSQQCWTVWKVNIFTRLKSMLLKLLLLMFCFIPCFPSSIRLNNPVRKWGPSPHVSGIPVDLTWDATDFDPGNGRSAAENSRPICETRDCFFITAVQSYSSTQLYSTYAQIIDFFNEHLYTPTRLYNNAILGTTWVGFQGCGCAYFVACLTTHDII